MAISPAALPPPPRCCARPVSNPGDRVALLFRNSPEYVALFYGALAARLAVVPLNVQERAQRAGAAGGTRRRATGRGRPRASRVARIACRAARRDPDAGRALPRSRRFRRRSSCRTSVAGAAPTARVTERGSRRHGGAALHLGHHRPAEGRDAEPRQPRREQRGDPGLPAARARGRRAHGDAVSLLLRQFGAAHAPRGGRDPAARGQPRVSAQGRAAFRARKGHRLLGRAVDVRDPDVALPPRGFRPRLDALPHPGRRRDDARGDPAHARTGAQREVLGHVRADRGHGPSHLPAARTPGRATRFGRHPARRHRDRDPQRAGRSAATRADRRALRARAEHHARVLDGRGGHAPGGGGRLAAHGRPRPPRRGRLPLHRWPPGRHDQGGLVPRQSAGGRGGARDAAGDRRDGRRLDARRVARPGHQGRDRAARWRRSSTSGR